jgi:hypothetical protein
MTVVYQLEHEYERPGGEDEVKDLGLYSTRENAIAAIERYKILPGFIDYPDGFRIYEAPLDFDQAWTEGFITPDPHDAPLPGYEYDEQGHLVKKAD